MAVDTAAKRFSMMNMGTVQMSPLFPPSGSVLDGDRSHLLNLYSGITLDGPPSGNAIPVFMNSYRRRRYAGALL